jgi:glycosyltransferase involved in cell wall biosynthesis
VRILIFHGYLLHGTGSNVYNAKLAGALVRAGHEVHLLCQDRDPLSLPWVDAEVVLEPDPEGLEVPPGRGVVWRPDIGGLLPVYVADRYEGVEARPFQDLTEEEVEGYIGRNVAAVRAVAAAVQPDLALANHLVMGPVVLARALGGDFPYAVKIHGSALEYTVKPYPRFMPYAVEGLRGARGVLVGSRHTAESLWAAVDVPGLRDRTRLGPPGVDIGEFGPRDPDEARAGLQGLIRRLREDADEAGGDPAGGPSSSFTRSAGEAAAALARLDPGRDRIVVFVGKLIASKGLELLLAAWPLVLAAEPDARLVVVGFGGFREGLEELAGALGRGDLDAARALRAEDGRELPELAAFLDGIEDREAYVRAAAALPGRIVWTGRMDHHELADLLPAAEALVTPSTFPEAFGMVAAEGAACGALPVVARHSGLAEVSERLAAAVPPEAREWLSFEVGPRAVEDLAACLRGWLSAPLDVRAATREAIVSVTREVWSWDGVARGVVAAASGDLDDLPEP